MKASTPNWKYRVCTAALGAVLGLILGFGASRVLHPPNKPAAQETVTPSSSANRRPASFLPDSARDEEDLAQAVSWTSRTHKWLWLASQAENATPNEMPRLLRLAAGDSELVRMLATRWAGLDPKHMLHTLMEDFRQATRSLPEGSDLMRQLLTEWGSKDPTQLAAALSDDDLFTGYEGFRWSGADAIIRQDPALGLRLIDEWQITSYSPSMTKVGEWAARDPKAAADVIGSLTNSFARSQALEALAKSWADSDPSAALDFARNLDSAACLELSKGVMQRWAKEDLQAAIQYASGDVDAATLAGLAGPLAAEWAKTDPAAVLAWSQESLPATARVGAVAALISSVAETDLEEGASLVAGLPPGGVKTQAVTAFVEAWVKQPDLDVESLGAWLDGLDDEEARRRALDSAQWSWIQNNRDTAKAFLASSYGDLAGEQMLRQLAGFEVRTDPQAALEWAQSLPGDHAQRAQTMVVEQWYSAHPDAALQWATREAQGEIRRQAIEGISRSVAFAGEDQLRAWANALDSNERQIARQTLDDMRLAPRYAETVEKVFGN